MDPLGQGETLVLPVERLLMAFDRRGRGAEHDRDLPELTAHDREIASMIAQPLVLLVRGVVLLVDDDEAEIDEWREDRRAGSDDDPRFAACDPPPFVPALAGREPAVHDRDGVAETLLRSRQQLRGEGDLRHEHQHRPAGGARARRELQVDLGLAAARHAVQQEHLEGVHRDGVDGDPLRGRELGLRRRRRCFARLPVAFLTETRHEPAFHQRRRRGTPSDVELARIEAGARCRTDPLVAGELARGAALEQRALRRVEVARGREHRRIAGRDGRPLMPLFGGEHAADDETLQHARNVGSGERAGELLHADRPRRPHVLDDRRFERAPRRRATLGDMYDANGARS